PCLRSNPGECPRTTISTPRLVCPWLDPRSPQHGTRTWELLYATEVSRCTKKPSLEVSWTRSCPERQVQASLRHSRVARQRTQAPARPWHVVRHLQGLLRRRART